MSHAVESIIARNLAKTRTFHLSSLGFLRKYLPYVNNSNFLEPLNSINFEQVLSCNIITWKLKAFGFGVELSFVFMIRLLTRQNAWDWSANFEDITKEEASFLGRRLTDPLCCHSQRKRGERNRRFVLFVGDRQCVNILCVTVFFQNFLSKTKKNYFDFDGNRYEKQR